MKVWIKETYDYPSMCIVDIFMPRWLFLLHYGTLADLNEYEEWKQIEVTPYELKKLLDQRAHIRI